MNCTELEFEKIKQQLKNRDILLTDIASALNLSTSHVTLVAKGGSTSKVVAKAISNCLGLPIEQVFGEKYNDVNKRGPKDRSKRRQEIKKAIINNQTVPHKESMA
ncbi:hypothetical protein CJF42_26175 [Pseudoalteromonas sp. NBT06-2]|uniref:hypothetical protein n=1 Tax=Pseudoalteromonas sp. NBT06-2 TaxID=2025950 RepID=UPI000BA5766B|nr:hypothetical protein [Pseudoalteromonas sp. NBT06-2]PAJ69411.1 hypothetical protein CJF42_26175 [Pseudoalteromonas sp. NBT06-2]